MRAAPRENFEVNIYFALFVLSLLLALSASYVFLERTTLPPFEDGIRPILSGMWTYNAWQNHRAFSEFAGFFYPMYPPFVHICYTVYFFIFGLHTGKELMVNTAFLIITMISIYGISKALYNEKVALLAVAIFLSFPGVFRYSRFGYMEFALMGMVALSIYFLVLTDYFSNRRYAVIFGIVLGLTALTKWSFLASVAGPVLVVALSAYLPRGAKNAGTLKRPVNFLISAIIAVIISAPWYAFHLHDFLRRFHSDKIDISYGNFSLTPHNASIFLGNLNFYMQASGSNRWNQHMDSYHFLVFLCVIFFYAVTHSIKIITYKQRYSPGLSKALLLFLWVVIPYVLISLPLFKGIKNYSHLLPILPAIAMIISAGVLSIPIKAARYAMVIFVLAIALPYWNINLRLPFIAIPPKTPILSGIRISLDARNTNPVHLEPVLTPASELQRNYVLPGRGNWLHRDILNFIAEDYAPKTGTPKVLLLGNEYVFRYDQFEYYNLQMERRVMLVEPFHAISRFFPDTASLEEAIFDPFFDYIIFKTTFLRSLWIETIPIQEVVDFIKAREQEFDSKYKKIKQLTLPDSDSVIVYKRSGI